MTEILVFPYLPLREAAVVGGWTLVPAQGAEADAFTSPEDRTKAEGLLCLYGGGKDTQIAGAYAAPPGGRVGDTTPVDQMQTLRRSVIVALLEGNPLPPGLVEEGETDPNGGWQSATSDNAALWGHHIDASGYTAAEYGAMVTTLSGGHNVLQPDSLKINPPTELPKPFMYGFLDAPYADATFKVLASGGEPSVRLGRAIDWLDLAWRNSPSLTTEVRVVLLRTGFEVLFQSDSTFVVRDRLTDLLDQPDAEQRARSWETLGGKEQAATISDLGWWFMKFAFLRNAIMHGGKVDSAMFEHEGRPHVWLGESRLRKAIQATVAAAGYPTVLKGREAREREARISKINDLLSS